MTFLLGLLSASLTFFCFLFSIKYANSSLFIGRPSNNSNDEGKTKNKRVLEDVKLKTDEQGYPLLPSWETIKDAHRLTKKLIIGKFLGEMHHVYHPFALPSIKWPICYHQGLPTVVEKGRSPVLSAAISKGLCP